MKKIKKKIIIRMNKVQISAVILCFTIFFVSIGYSAFNTNLIINDVIGSIIYSSDIKVDEYSVYSTSSTNSFSNSSSFDDFSIMNSIHLNDSDSWVKYRINVTNIGNLEAGIANIINTTLPENIIYEIEGYNMQEPICDDDNDTNCSLNASKSFYITFKYRDGAVNNTPSDYNIKLDFNFQRFYNVSYSDGICIGCPSKAMATLPLSVTLNDFVYISVEENLVTIPDTRYTLNNSTGQLTINEVNGNIDIINSLYTRLAYIQSNINDSQYIVTDYVPNQNTVVEYDGMVFAGDTALFGSRDLARNAKSKFTLQFINDNIYRSSLVNNDLRIANDYIVGVRYLFKMLTSGLSIDNKVVGSFPTTVINSFASTYPLYIFAINTNGTASNFGTNRLYNMRIYENTILLRNYIPVLDKDGIPCLYDTVNRNFLYKEGNGTLTYALPDDQSITINIPNITSSSTLTNVHLGDHYTTTLTPLAGYSLPDYVIVLCDNSILIRNIDYTYDSATGMINIPSVEGDITISSREFVSLDYIHATGTQFIDTGYIPKSNTKVVFTHIPTATSYTPWVTYFGSRDGANNTSAFYASSGISSSVDLISAFVGNVHMGNANLDYSHVIGTSEVITLSANEYSVRTNGQLVIDVTNSEPVTFTNAKSLYIFGRNIDNNTLNAPGDIKLVQMQIYEDDELIMDFIPTIDPDGIVCLYEDISNEYFYNGGSGVFIAS